MLHGHRDTSSRLLTPVEEFTHAATNQARRHRVGLGLAVVALLGACAAPGLEPVDLSEAGWRVWTGQATWQRNRDAAAIAGELIVARHDDNRRFVAFSKTPVSIFAGAQHHNGWRLDYAVANRAQGGRGEAPRRIVWFRLAEVIEHEIDPPGWTVERPAINEIIVSRTQTGERIRMLLDG